MGKSITFDAEKVSFNLARLKKGGENFEVAIDPDKIVQYKSNPSSVQINEILKSENIFSDVKKGQKASDDKMQELFGSIDVENVAKLIFDQGEIQFTQEYRQKLQEDKRRKIINIIHKKGVDPKTSLPHPITRIENAFEEAKVRIDYFKKAEVQVEDIVKQIRVVLPIRFETKRIQIKVGHQYSSKIYTLLNAHKIIEQKWDDDGGLRATIEIPAGIINEFFDELNSMTHGQNETTEINTQR